MADKPKRRSSRARQAQRRWGIVIAVVALIAILGWTAFAWNRATALGDARFSTLIEKEKADIEQDANAIRITGGASIAYLYGIPATVAGNGALIEMLAKTGREVK